MRERVIKKSLYIFILTVVLLFEISAIAADKVVVIPINSSPATTDKLWGQGRPGVTTSAWTLHNGIRVAASTLILPWYAAESACPIKTWVCTASDIDLSTLVLSPTTNTLMCDGSAGIVTPTTRVNWLSDADVSGSFEASAGKAVIDDDGAGGSLPYINAQPSCVSFSVLCCKY